MNPSAAPPRPFSLTSPAMIAVLHVATSPWRWSSRAAAVEHHRDVRLVASASIRASDRWDWRSYRRVLFLRGVDDDEIGHLPPGQVSVVGSGLTSSRGARRRIPPGRVRELLEVRARRVGTREIPRILYPGDDRQPAIVVRHHVQVPVLGDRRLLAVRRAVLAHVTRAQIRGHDLEVAGRDIPLRNRMALPRGLCWSGRAAEAKQSGLRASVRLDLQRRVVLPGDPQAPGQAHDAAGAVGTALLSCGFVLRGIPALSHLAPLGVQRDRVDHALGRRDHAVLPVFDDRRYPVASEVDRRRLSRRGRRTASPAAATGALGVERGCRPEEQKREEKKRNPQSTTSLAPRPQVKPSAGRVRLTIRTRYSPGTRDGRPPMCTLSPTFRVSRFTPACASCPVPPHSTAHRCETPWASGASICTNECGFRYTNWTIVPWSDTDLVVS